MDLNDIFLAKVREKVEENTRRPAYLCSDEEWAQAVDEVMEEEKKKGNPITSAPICPHCGSIAPYGDERNMWIWAHIDSRLHRWWWKLKARGL